MASKCPACNKWLVTFAKNCKCGWEAEKIVPDEWKETFPVSRVEPRTIDPNHPPPPCTVPCHTDIEKYSVVSGYYREEVSYYKRCLVCTKVVAQEFHIEYDNGGDYAAKDTWVILVPNKCCMKVLERENLIMYGNVPKSETPCHVCGHSPSCLKQYRRISSLLLGNYS